MKLDWPPPDFDVEAEKKKSRRPEGQGLTR